MELDEKIGRVKESLRGRRVAVGFSGGADSTALLDIAAGVAEEVVAFTVDTGVMPRGFTERASEIAARIGVPHKIIELKLLDNREFRENSAKRCFVCKNIIYSSIMSEAHAMGLDVVVDGTTVSDMFEDRPGVLVNHLLGIESPLLNAGMKRSDVLEYLKLRGLDYSENTTCLATRINTGEEITPEKINRVSYAESLIGSISDAGAVRVRHDGNSAVIQVEDPEGLLNKNILRHIEGELRAIGFERVLLDLSGYSKGEEELVLYRPCREADSRIMFEVKLPYPIDVKETCSSLESMKPRCSEKMGVIMLDLDGRNVTIFRNGKIVSRNVKDREDAEDVLLKVLPHIIRRLDDSSLVT